MVSFSDFSLIPDYGLVPRLQSHPRLWSHSQTLVSFPDYSLIPDYGLIPRLQSHSKTTALVLDHRLAPRLYSRPQSLLTWRGKFCLWQMRNMREGKGEGVFPDYAPTHCLANASSWTNIAKALLQWDHVMSHDSTQDNLQGSCDVTCAHLCGTCKYPTGQSSFFIGHNLVYQPSVYLMSLDCMCEG